MIVTNLFARPLTRDLRLKAPKPRYCFFLVLVALVHCPGSSHGSEFDPGVVGFQLHLGEEISSFRVTPLFALPYESVSLRISGLRLDQSIEVTTTGGRLKNDGPRQWTWTAPSTHGPQQLVITRSPGKETMTVQAFVIIPLNKVVDDRLNGYLIGKYPSTPLRNLASYERPDGFIEVTDENAKTLLTPHSQRYLPFLVGMARYRATSQHGPSVHVDARGTRARW